MGYCENCGQRLTPAAAYCEHCGHAVRPPSADAPTLVTPARAPRAPAQRVAPDIAPAPRPRGRRRSLAVAGAAAAIVAAAAAIVLLATGALDGETTHGSAAGPVTAPEPRTSTLEPLPERDQADGYLDLLGLDDAVTLAADHPRPSAPGVTDWAVYAIPGRDAATVCDEVAEKWIDGTTGLGDAFTDDADRARALTADYRMTPGGCVHSLRENEPSIPDLGPSQWDIAVRAFTKDDPLTHEPQAVRMLGAITPRPAPIYEGPYAEVSVVHRQHAASEPFADGRVAADLKPKAKAKRRAESPAPATGAERVPSTATVACDANISVADGGCRFADNVFWTYWTRGEAPAIDVYDPDRRRFDAMWCELADQQVTCTGDTGTVVSFPQSAVDAYDQEQADRYAAGHAVG